MNLRPIDELLYPPAVKPSELHAVGTLGGQPWHSSGYMAVAGDPPKGARQPGQVDYDFGQWLNGHDWRTATPDGWWYDGSEDEADRTPIVRFKPEWKAKGEAGYRRNYINGQFFRCAVRLGAVSWEWREDGALVAARDASGNVVAMVACMRLPVGGFPK